MYPLIYQQYDPMLTLGKYTHDQLNLMNLMNVHQFEIDELMPSFNMYKQALAESMKDQTDKIQEESKNDNN